MIESGTSVTRSMRANEVCTPATALRIELPAPDLRAFFTDYYVLD